MKHSIPIQLRFNDTDALGHVNNSTYFSFYDLGKTEYFRTLYGDNYFTKEIDIKIQNNDMELNEFHAEVDFLEPVFLTDDISVETSVTHIGSKSFSLYQQIRDNRTNNVKCKCTTIMVGYDFKKKITIPISDEWRKVIADYEERPDFLDNEK